MSVGSPASTLQSPSM
jgi:hypothetical protein